MGERILFPRRWFPPATRSKRNPFRSRPLRIIEALEERLLLSVTLTASEQLMLELINRARANPVAEAALFGIDLNEGLAPGTISSTPKQPLAPNDALRTALVGHLDDMIANDFFSHTGSSGSSFTQRMQSAGYTGWTTAGENLAWQGWGGTPNETASVVNLHQLLFVDSGISGRGHRKNLLKGSFREVGSGVRTGAFMGWNAVVLGQDFATRSGSPFLTGVAYSDAVVDDDFYTVGEGLGSITVTAVNASNDVFSTITGASGGYSLALPAGTYTVTADGGSLGGSVVVGVTIGSSNVKVDFTPDQVTGGGTPETVALFDPSMSRFYLRNQNAAGAADHAFGFGPQGAGWVSVVGDFDNDGIDSVGLFDAGSSTFYLKNTHTAGAADLVVRFGPAGAGWEPIVGDWNGDGTDTVGLFDPLSGQFFLTNSNAPGPADLVVRYGPAGAGWEPIVGDWNGDGTDTFGLFDPLSSTFFLKNTNTSGAADLVVRFGPAGAGWTPMAGDWDGEGGDSIGLFSAGSSTFFLTDTNVPGVADYVFRFGPSGAGWRPLSGNWGLAGSAASGFQTAFTEGGSDAAGIARAFAQRSVEVLEWRGGPPGEAFPSRSHYRTVFSAVSDPPRDKPVELHRLNAVPAAISPPVHWGVGFSFGRFWDEAQETSSSPHDWAQAVDQCFSDAWTDLVKA